MVIDDMQDNREERTVYPPRVLREWLDRNSLADFYESLRRKVFLTFTPPVFRKLGAFFVCATGAVARDAQICSGATLKVISSRNNKFFRIIIRL